MRKHARIGGLVCLVAIACCGTTQAADTTDVAKFVPEDTPFYMGWSAWLEKDSAEFKATRKYMKSIMRGIAELDGEDEELQAFTSVYDRLVDIPTHAGGIAIFDLNFDHAIPELRAAAIVHAGSEARTYAEIITELVEKLNDEFPVERQRVEGVPFTVMRFGETPMSFWWGTHKDCLILALDEASVDCVVDCLNGNARPLSGCDELQFDRRKVGANMEGPFFCLYADVPHIIKRAKSIAEEGMGGLPPIVDQLLNELGISAVRSKYMHIDKRNDVTHSAIFAHIDGPSNGLLKLWDQDPLERGDLEIIPKDAYWAQVGNLDLPGVWAEVLRVVEAVAPDSVMEVEGMVTMAGQMLGFSITDDLLPAFGDTWAIYDAPDHGGILLSGTVLVADAEEPAVVDAAMDKLIQIAAMIVEEEIDEDITLRLRETEHHGRTIRYVMIGGAPVPVAPAWSFHEGRWVFGLYPQSVAAALEQIDSGTRGPSILDHPAVEAAQADLPNQIQGFAYCDTKYLIRLFYPLTNGIQTAMASMFDVPGQAIDLTLMPPVAEAADKVTNYVGTTSRDDDGVLCAGVGDGSPMGTAVVVGAAATAALLPSLSQARSQAKSVVSMSNMRGMAMACMVYAMDNNDALPPSFDELVDSSMITRDQLNSPHDEEGVISYTLLKYPVTISKVRNPSRAVLIFENTPVDGTVAAAFLDGHVERLPMFEFMRMLRETCEELEIEDQIPSRYR